MNKSKLLGAIVMLLSAVISLLIAGCNRGFSPEILPLPKQLTTYEPMSTPADNPLTPEKVALGRQLFFDERLSPDGTRSCSSCHTCEHGLTDGLPTATGFGNRQLRNTSTLWNIGYQTEFYRDGRSKSLEEQALSEWVFVAMGAKPEEIVVKLNALEGY